MIKAFFYYESILNEERAIPVGVACPFSECAFRGNEGGCLLDHFHSQGRPYACLSAQQFDKIYKELNSTQLSLGLE